jgi:hypothetical protein
MADLFDSKDLTSKEKLIKSRKITTNLTKWAIDYLNDSEQFICWRQNNIPSTRSETTFKPDGTKDVKFHFKKNNVTFKLLDIAAVNKATGQYFELEVKTGKDKLSPGQQDRINALKLANAVSFAFSDKETFLIQIKPYLLPRKPAF